jgi:hypothetical protein
MVMAGTLTIYTQPYQEPSSDVTTKSSASHIGQGVLRVNSGTYIGNAGWKLALDLGVDLEYGRGFVVAVNRWIDEYGHGNTQQEAITDLLTSLVDFRESLERQSNENVLSNELAEILERLRILLVRE